MIPRQWKGLVMVEAIEVIKPYHNEGSPTLLKRLGLGRLYAIPLDLLYCNDRLDDETIEASDALLRADPLQYKIVPNLEA